MLLPSFFLSLFSFLSSCLSRGFQWRLVLRRVGVGLGLEGGLLNRDLEVMYFQQSTESIHLPSSNTSLPIISLRALRWQISTKLCFFHKVHKLIKFVFLLSTVLSFICVLLLSLQKVIQVIGILKNWSIIDLQCCVSFRYIAQWFSDIYIYILFQVLFPYRLL